MRSNAKVYFGTHEFLVLTSVPAAADQSLKGRALKDVGTLTVDGVYVCEFDVAGLGNAEVNARASAVTGTVNPILETRFLDGSVMSQSVGTDFVAATNKETVLAVDKGVERMFYYFTLASESIAFDRAEVNAL